MGGLFGCGTWVVAGGERVSLLLASHLARFAWVFSAAQPPCFGFGFGFNGLAYVNRWALGRGLGGGGVIFGSVGGGLSGFFFFGVGGVGERGRVDAVLQRGQRGQRGQHGQR